MSDAPADETLNYDYAKQVEAHLGGNKFAAREKTQERIARERKAGLTAKQRDRARRAAPARKPVGYRLDLEMIKLIKALGKHLGKSDTEVVETGVAALAASLPGFQPPSRGKA